MIFQEPMTAMNPVYTIGFQIVETIRSHFDMSPKEAKERAIELLTLVEIPEPERRFDAFPHQLSGGQRQRAMIAQALACEPQLLVADEPTTALDVTVQAEILKLMRDLRERVNAGVVLITHDMGVVADMADRIVVMQHGRIVETGTADQIFNHAAAPLHPAAAGLGAALRHGARASRGGRAHGARPGGAARPRPAQPIMVAENLVLEYPKRGNQPVFRAVDDVSLTIGRGEVRRPGGGVRLGQDHDRPRRAGPAARWPAAARGRRRQMKGASAQGPASRCATGSASSSRTRAPR